MKIKPSQKQPKTKMFFGFSLLRKQEKFNERSTKLPKDQNQENEPQGDFKMHMTNMPIS